MYTRRLVYQHGISRQLLKRMSDEKYKVADAWSLDDANVKEFKKAAATNSGLTPSKKRTL